MTALSGMPEVRGATARHEPGTAPGFVPGTLPVAPRAMPKQVLCAPPGRLWRAFAALVPRLRPRLRRIG